MVNADTVTEGQIVTLTCSTTCTLTGSPAFIWYRNGSPLSLTNQKHLFTASPEVSGSYICAVKGYEHLPSLAVALNVKYAPKDTSVSVSPSDEILEGSSVTLTCSSDANPPVQRYTWFKKTGAVSSWRGSGQSLTVANILSKDSGQYYCKAQNQQGAQNSTAVTIDVQYAPKNTSISVSPSGEIEEGSSVTLTCSSDANPPVQSYTWFKKNETIWQTGSGQSLNMSNFTSWNGGQYYCESRNTHGAQNSTGLTVIYAAMTMNKEGSLYILAGTSVCAALVIVIVGIVWRRRSISTKEEILDTEANPSVYANVSEMTVNGAAVEEKPSLKEEAQSSKVEKPHFQNQEEVLYSNIQKKLPQCEDDVQYASVQFLPSNAAPGSQIPTAEDVIYSTVAKQST
ncbi:hypothetical protein SKAU_G00417960 [Synaphobranchus kaupii]|uniref:Ig-like domain-containing protein n=1 Tax=Synaphobranchus kaupii TaxID=118154 RepID=A0A9Q1E614_SYNKA|nr:hypothetical protein SKAU_G00417960 [Synaphobranchus kaupii]